MNVKQVKNIFGNFKYKDVGGGFIQILGNWVEKNITTIECKIIGKVRFNKLVAHQLQQAMEEIYNTDKNLIDPIDFHSSGGTFVTRRKRNNSKNPSLSLHSWGIAIDVNVMYGKDGKGGAINIGNNSYQPRILINIFNKYGFEYGGNWKGFKDGMHFQIAKVLNMTVAEPTLINKVKVVVNNHLLNIKAWLKDNTVVSNDKDIRKSLEVKTDTPISLTQYFRKLDKNAVIKWDNKTKKLYVYSKIIK